MNPAAPAQTAFQVLARITKIDEEKREVTALLTSEAVDKANEKLDYDASKPAFEAWMQTFKDATKGESCGNLREMHGKVAAGKFINIEFDDVAKTITGTAKVVDDAAWQKTKLGVYTGFSIGGNYGKTWPDPTNEKVMCFAPSEIVETSLVDNPCNPDCTFTAIKADGTTEMRKFLAPSNLVVDDVDNVEQGWKAHDGSFHATKAKAIRHNTLLKAQRAAAEITAPAEAALKKLADDTAQAVVAGDDAAAVAADPVATDPAAAPAAPAAEPAAPAAAADPIVNTAAAEDGTVPGAQSTPAEPSADVPAAPPVVEATPAVGDTPASDAPAKATVAGMLKALHGADAKKNLWDVCTLADLIQGLVWLQESLDWEAMYEKDGSTLPDELKAHISGLCDFLRRLVAEETAELQATDETVLEMAAMPVKALTSILKAVRATGAINAVVAAIAKAATAPAAESADTDTPLMKATVQTEALTQALTDLTAKTTEGMTKLQDELAALKRQPQAPKGFVRGATPVSKSEDGETAASGAGGKPTVEAVQAQIGKLSPEEGALLAMKLATQHRTPAAPTK